MSEEATKAIILVRVSTKEQEDGHSIDAQQHRLLEYCERKNLQVIKTFSIIESSNKCNCSIYIKSAGRGNNQRYGLLQG